MENPAEGEITEVADATTRLKAFLYYLTVAGIKLVSLPICKAIKGRENIPEGPYIIAANHRSLIDGVVMVNEFNRIRRKPVHIIAYQEPFKNPFFGPIMKISGCIPFDRGDANSRIEALETALGFLKEGEPIAFFPEAHLSQSNKMRKARPGLAIAVIESGVPVLPVGIRNSEKVLEPGTNKFRLGVRASVEIGKPISFPDYREEFDAAGKKERMRILKRISDPVMLAIAELSGQEYPFAKGERSEERLND
jgi:1-acyl-sn-glycerol-3-phosphate acyltransferase